jgi:hypothetical protein
MTDRSPANEQASRVFSEAIDAVVQGKPMYPDRSFFAPEDQPNLEKAIAEHRRRGIAAVVVSADGTIRVIEATLFGRLIGRFLGEPHMPKGLRRWLWFRRWKGRITRFWRRPRQEIL